MGCTMAKCRNCNIEILDASAYCPLCRNVLEKDDGVENMYPDGHSAMRKHQMLARIYLFCSIMAEAALVLLNYVLGHEIWWSVLTGLGLLYSYLVLRYAIIGKSGHRTKASVLVLLAVLSAVAADFAVGYRGWSVDFMLPAGIIAMDIVLLVCLFVNHRSWQSYIPWLMTMLVCSLLPIVLFVTNLENYWYFAYAPVILTASILLGVFIIGGRRAADEVKRRFHF